ncbi:olfactory receptor 5B21-like [Rhinatrema bivittatum]|uniref:olfactory receptor 5B21-like n=1 Tax=Rhinatrema bivittatum TaxID=194408 RepID=UPI00112A3050|nr:olfactory receptor 5B21-like [Rhinatrema bivittatum]
MAYDRYVAVCDPLRYSLVMNHRVCVLLAAASWITGTLPSGVVTTSVTRLSFCASNEINHIICDLMALLKLSCTDTAKTETQMFIAATLIPAPAFLVTLISYIYIISAILRIRSAEGKRKAFSTCSSHLTVVSIYYLSMFCIYVRPISTYSEKQGQVMDPINVENLTMVTEFIILGLSDNPQLQVPLFVLFLLIYLITLLGNLVIITVTCADPRLHTPMYFFLSNLALTDICCISTIFPKLLGIHLSGNKTISYAGCIAQLYFFLGSNSIEVFLLTAMAYDRYVAICNPLCYSLVMNQRVCVLLAAASWITGTLPSGTIMSSVIRLSFCDSNKINHIFCDLMPLLKLSCIDTAKTETIVFVAGMLLSVPAFLVTLTSYIYIISAILRIRSAEGKRKAFSTCSSHLTVISIYYLSMFSMYMSPSSTYSQEQGKILSVVYTAVTPMLNPLIYSLRNKEVKNAVRKVMGK